MAKYADDATLLVPEKTDVQIQDELISIRKLAAYNKLTINLSKTGELKFHRPYLQQKSMILQEYQL